MNALTSADIALAAEITHTASRHTYYTIRCLADGPRMGQAFAAYAYFRWVDDTLDAPGGSEPDRAAFLARQQALLSAAYQGGQLPDACDEENLLLRLAAADRDPRSGLHTYLSQMMAVMRFDAQRRGRLISQAELNGYTHSLSTAVTEAMHYFIGHDCASPSGHTRYLAVSAAHITHMLRDTYDDLQAGYYNIPAEVLAAGQITPHEIHSEPYRAWVRERVTLARRHFGSGRQYLSQVASRRCRLAGFAYTARFERLLDTFEADDCLLRPQYADTSSLTGVLKMYLSVLSALTRPTRLVRA